MIAGLATFAILGTTFATSYADFGKGGKNSLTDEEKTAIEAMSDTERQEFMSAKKEEMTAKREAQEAVIDALLAGDTLSADQEAVKQEIINERAERKTAMAEKQAQMEILKPIMEKKRAGEELTADEEAQLEEAGGRWGKMWGGRGNKWGMNGERGERGAQSEVEVI